MTYIRLLASAAKLSNSSGVKLLRLLSDWLPTTTGFCCETLHQFWCETFTVIAWLITTTGFCYETLHQFWCETFTVIAWLTTYDCWLLLRNFAPVLVWNFYGDCLTDYLRLLAFAPKLLWWLSDDILLWLLGYRKNEWVRSNSGLGWQVLTSGEKNTTRTRYQSGFKRKLLPWHIWKHGQYCFFIPQQKGPCLLSGVYVNDKRGNHPPHVETRVKDRKRVTLLCGFVVFSRSG